jgi:2'-5' RNA ligase
MRIFVGIDIPDHIKEAIQIESSKFLKYCESFRQVEHHLYHVTLKFLGELSVSDLEDLEDILRASLKGYKAFDVHLKDLGYFEKKDGNILWMGMGLGVGKLKELHKAIDDKINERFQLEKGFFSPHVTLARKVIVEDLNTFKKNKTKEFIFEAKEVVIFYSHHVDDVLTYTPMTKIKLD